MRRQTRIILTILFSLTACNQKDEKSFCTPWSLDDGWEISVPDKTGFDTQKLETVMINKLTTIIND